MPAIYAIILILLCLPTCVSAHGTEKIQFSHLTATDGLPHQQINGLAQDSTGYIWIGTRNGLGKYDGYSIRNYYHSPENPRSLSHNFVRKIFPDSRGRIWILTILGLCRYLPETDDFKAYGIAADFASITETDDGSILCGGEGLYRIRAGSDSIERIRFDHGYVISLACDKEGQIFASTNGGIFVADRLQTDFRKLDSSLYADFITGLDAIIPLFTDSKGRLWAGRNGHGAMTIDPATGRRETITPHGTVRTIAEDRHGRMWLGTSDGIDIIDTDGSVRHICRAGASQSSLSDNSVYSILPDRDGNIWAGTFFGGINLYVPDRNIFNVPSPGYGEDELGGKVVRMMCETDDGTLWIATENGGLLQMDRKTGTTRRFTEIPQLGANIHSLYHAGGDSHMWIGTFRNGLFRYNLNNGTWRRYLPADGLGSDAIFHINTDSKGVLWVATTQGLSYYDPSSDSFIKTGDATIDNNFTYTIYPDRNANLWIGTTRHGLRRIDAHSGEITPVNVDTSPLRLNDSFVTCICEDSNGNLLVGSNNSGLQMLPTGKAPATAPDLSPLANTTICAIVPDRDGKDLWISSATGLYHRDGHTGKLTRFTTADGLPSTQMNLSSWHVSSDNEIYFGTVNGLFSFRPENIASASPRTASVHLMKLAADGKEIVPGDSTGILAVPADLSGPVTIPYHLSRNIGIEYGVIMPGNAAHMLFQAKLDGEDSSWRDMNHERHITLFNLSPGTYTLLLRASSSSDGWANAPVRSFIFTVAPPLYRSPAAYIIYLSCALLAIFVIVHVANARTREKRALAEAQREKENEIRISRTKTEFFSMMSHELKTPLTLIGAPLRNMARHQNFPHDFEADLNLAITNADRMERIVSNLLTFNKLQQGDFPLVTQSGDPVETIRMTGEQFAAHASEKGIALHIDCTSPAPAETCGMWFSKTYLDHIVSNLLSNAIKFTPAGGHVWLTSHISTDTPDGAVLTMEVADTGCGIAPYELDRIFTFHYRGTSETNAGGWGIGLALVKQLVEKHGGRLEVQSTPGEGSVFKASLSLDKDKLNGATATEDEPTETSVSGNTLQSENSVRHTVLIVEDNREMLGFLVRILKPHYSIITASDGEKAITAARREKVDLILSDVMMPVMDGMELCRRIKNDFTTSHIPVVLLTARSDGEDMIEGLEHGADAYMTKPFTPYGLELQIRNLLHSIKSRNTAISSQTGDAPDTSGLTELDRKFLENLNRIVGENISNSRFCVADITAALGISRSLLYTKLQALTSMAPADYMRCRRLELACTLLKNGHNVSETAYATGFTDPAHFSRMFKKRYGVAPSDYTRDRQSPDTPGECGMP